jgi:glycosyltransferase involved in cell wall biosynthesis
LRVAEKCVDHIFTASADSFPLRSKKMVVTGHGIDSAVFAPQPVPKTIDLVTVGRITPSKNLQQLLVILKAVRKQQAVTLTIAGTAVTAEEQLYEKTLRTAVTELGLENQVRFIGKVAQPDLPKVLSASRVFVTAATNGSLDKAALEAMACGVDVVSMAPGLSTLPLADRQVDTEHDFVTQVVSSVESGVTHREEYVAYVHAEHSLATLISKMLRVLAGKKRA